MDNELRFDYNNYWTPEKSEPNYVEESYDEPTDQDFWELHKFVLECEIELCDPIYSESVGSAVKNVAGAVIDKILEAFIRIAEAFKKQSMKKAVKWLKKNEEKIKELATNDYDVHDALQAINFGQICLSTYAEEFEKWAKKPGDISLVLYECSKILGDVYKSAHEEKERIFNLRRLKVDGDYRPGYDDWKKWDNASISELMNSVILSMDLKGYDRWYKYAQDLRVRIKKANRQGQLRDEENGIDRVFLMNIPKEMMEAFQGITSGIKRLKEKVDENAKKLKSKKPIVAPTAESYCDDLFDSEHIEESSDVTDQDFWELHKFVLECELGAYDDIYTESVGSSIKRAVGTVIDKIMEVFLRICEAFKKKSTKKAIKWLNMNYGTIQTFATDDETIRRSLLNIWAGYTCIAAYAKAFNKWANKPNMNDVTPEKLGEELLNIYNTSANERLIVKATMKSAEEAWKRWETSSISKLMDDVTVSLYDGTFDQWYRFAQNLRVNIKKADRQGKLYKVEDVLDRVIKSTLVKIPTEMLKSFDMITEGIKAIQKRYNEMYKEIKARDKVKKTDQTPKPATESYYVSFEPEVDILF